MIVTKDHLQASSFEVEGVKSSLLTGSTGTVTREDEPYLEAFEHYLKNQPNFGDLIQTTQNDVVSRDLISFYSM